MAVCNTVEDFLDDIVEKHLAELRANDQEYIEAMRLRKHCICWTENGRGHSMNMKP